MYSVTLGQDAERNYLECAVGNDKLHSLCMSTCNNFYNDVKNKIDRSLESKK
jgi:hypothetical protein